MTDISVPPTRWESLASAGATAIATFAAIVQENPAPIRDAMARIATTPWWLSLILRIDVHVWWVLTIAVGAGLWWFGVKLTARWGWITLFIAPIVMLVLPGIVGWLLLQPVRVGTPTNTQSDF